MKLLEFLKSLIGLILSLLVVIKSKIFRIDTGYYFISNNNNLIDKRSLVYLKPKNLSKSIAIVRSQNFLTSLRLFLSFRNTILLNYIINFFETFDFLSSKKNKFFNFIFKHLNLKEIHTIDDYRNIELISEICLNNKIKLFVYQHGRLSTSLHYQKTLSRIEFDKYFVWSPFFKKKSKKFNKDFKKSNIKIKKRFDFSVNQKKINNIRKKILIIQEDKISISKMKSIVLTLNKKKKFQLFFKFRPNVILNDQFLKFLKKNNVFCFHKENIYGLLKNQNFDFLLAFNSTLILESSFFNVLPVLIYDKKPELKDYLEDKVFFKSHVKNLYTNLDKIYKKKNMINKIKKKLWN